MTVTFTDADTHAVVVVDAEMVPLFVSIVVIVTLVVVDGDKEDTRDEVDLEETETPPVDDPTFVLVNTTLLVANELLPVVVETKADADKKPLRDGLLLDTRETLDLKDEDTDTEFERD